VSPPPHLIHHLVPASELARGCSPDSYSPDRLAEDGFVHCSRGRDVVLKVASDYFGNLAEDLWVLEIDASVLGAALRFEEPAAIPGGGTSHLEGSAPAAAFPHVYGPIDRRAIRSAPPVSSSASEARSAGLRASARSTKCWRRSEHARGATCRAGGGAPVLDRGHSHQGDHLERLRGRRRTLRGRRPRPLPRHASLAALL
jgi:uncharacterized protein (DUF952 family)